MRDNIKVMEITPEMASDLLDRGGKNRPVRNTRVSYYAADMKAGDWAFTGDSIKIDRTGQVLDGQHRLRACVEAKTPFKTLVVYDVDEAHFATLDDGAPRSLGDNLALKEVPYYNPVAAALAWVWLYDHEVLTLDQRPWLNTRGTKRQLLAFYDECDPEQWKRAAQAAFRVKSLIGSVGISGACHFIFQRHSPVKADQFFEELMSGAIVEDNAVILLRKRLLRDSYSDRHERLKAGAKIALIIKAWSAFVENKPMRQLKIVAADRETFPVAAP